MAIDPRYGKGLKITSGKGDYIQRRMPDGKYKPVCLCAYNIDLSPGCISNTLPKNFDLEKWRKRFLKFYDGITTDTKIFDPKAGKRSATRHNCTYCYARRTNYHSPLPYFADESTLKGLEKDIVENQIKYIRLGKKVECGNKENRNLLLKILDIGGKHDVQFIIPTKYLEFNKAVANKLIRTNSTLGFSIGADRFEDGACSHRCDNEFRLRQAHKYLEAGVNTILKIVTDVTVHPKEAESRGWFAYTALKNFPRSKIEIIPVRAKAKKFAFEATGESWEILQSPKLKEKIVVNLERNKPRYVMEKDITVLIGNYIHEYYHDLVKNEQFCGHIGTKEEGIVFCDMCHLTDKKGKKLQSVSFPMSDLPPSPGASRSRKNYIDSNNWQKVYALRNDKKFQVKMDEILKQSEGEKQQGILKI